MKKERIVEIVYLMAVLVFLGICVAGRRTDEPVVNASDNFVVTPTKVAVEHESNSDKIEDDTEKQEGNQETGEKEMPEITPTLSATPSPTPEPEKFVGAKEIRNEYYDEYDNETQAWWFQRKEDHSPSGSGEVFSIAPYSAYYLNTDVAEGDKVIYLTFDCGYENGFTPMILDALAEKNVKALFFVTKDFVVKNPEYVARMKEEGHLVGNHTVRHLSSPDLTPEELNAELSEVAKTITELTGYTIDPYFRPPMGEYSERTLKVAQDMGYASIFWSIAYYDYDVNNQPGKDYVVDHFATYHHNGTVVLMHNTSRSNAEALRDVIDLLITEGYRFGELTEFAK